MMISSMAAAMPPPSSRLSNDGSVRTTSSFFSGTTDFKVDRGESRIVCRKPDIHPPFYREAKVFCKGEHVLTTGGTQEEYVVDIWSGNHPFFRGDSNATMFSADQVEKFRKKFGSIGIMNNIPTITKSIPKESKKSKKDAKGKKKK